MRAAFLFSIAPLSSTAVAIFWDSSLRWIVVFAMVAMTVCGLRRASAAARHVAWMASFSALLAMPILVLALPKWAVLPWHSGVIQQEVSKVAVEQAEASAEAFSADSQESEAFRLDAHIEAGSVAANPRNSARDTDSQAARVANVDRAEWEWKIQSGSALNLLDNLGRIDTLRHRCELAWAIGVAICLLRLIAGGGVVLRLTHRCQTVSAGPLRIRVDAIRRRLGIRKPVRLLLTSRREMPMAWGIWRPTILLPEEAIDWDQSQIEAVLLHELGHIHRRDPLTHVLSQVVCAMHWFNPLVWIAAWRLGVERERACDDLVLRAGMKPSLYAEQLLVVVSRFNRSKRLPCTALAMAQRERLESRIDAILDSKHTRKEMTMPTFVFTLVFAAGATLAAATLSAQDDSPDINAAVAVTSETSSDGSQEGAEDPAPEIAQKPAPDAAKAPAPDAVGNAAPEVEPIANPIRNAGFEESEPGRRDFGWKLGRISTMQPKQGERSGFLQSGASPRPGLVQGFDATPYRGKRIRYRAAVRVESNEAGEGQAQLWFRVDRRKEDGKRAVGAFDNMNDRPIQSNEWKYYDLVGDVDEDASSVTLGMFFTGQGKAWVDDVTVQVVGKDVPVTTVAGRRALAANDQARREVRNPGFELGAVGDRVPGWSAAELNGYRGRISDKEPKSGKQCGLLERRGGSAEKKDFGALNSGVDATPYRGKRVRFRAAVRTKVDGPGNEARLWLRVDLPRTPGKAHVGAFDNMHDRPITATQWQYYEIVGDVAPDATGIIFGMLLMGDGEAYIDDVSFEVVGEHVEATTKVIGALPVPTRPPGDPIDTLGPGLYEIVGSMDVVSSRRWPFRAAASDATVLIPLPLSYRDQVPVSYELHANPPGVLKSVEVYRDQPNNYVARVLLSDLDKHKGVEVKFRSAVLIGPSDFDEVPSTVAIPDTWPQEAQPWLASTWCVDASHERIKAIAKSIRDESDDVLEIIGMVERKAMSLFRSAQGRVTELTAVQALDKRGSCTSCANLVAALLRASDIPARVLSGYPAWSGPLQTHYIVEAYVPQYGWYPVESTRCQSPWPNSHQVNVAIIPTEHESKEAAGRRPSGAGGVPYLSLTEVDRRASIDTRGSIEGAPYCDHLCKLVRRFEAGEADWKATMQWARPRWAKWVAAEQELTEGRIDFGLAAELIKAESPQELVAELSQ